MVAQARAQPGRGGAIINMSSVNAVMAIPTIAGYNASKGGVNNLTRCGLVTCTAHPPDTGLEQAAVPSPLNQQGSACMSWPSACMLKPCNSRSDLLDSRALGASHLLAQMNRLAALWPAVAPEMTIKGGVFLTYICLNCAGAWLWRWHRTASV